MTERLIGGALGLLLGLSLQRAGALAPQNVRKALTLHRSDLLRTVLFALGAGTLLVAVLGWLAVLDVDLLAILPLHGGVVVGGLIFGLAWGSMGRCELAALGAIGGGRLLPGLCAVAGGVLGAAAWALCTVPLKGVYGLIPVTDKTLFQVTLTGEALWSGGFLGHGCLGLVWMALSLCVRPEAETPLPAETEVPPAPPEWTAPAEAPTLPPAGDTVALPPEVPDLPPEEQTAAALPDAEAAAAETVVATLPQEEPLTVDTGRVTLPPEVQEALDAGAPDPEEQSAFPGVRQIEPLDRTPGESAALPAAATAPRIVPDEPSPDDVSPQEPSPADAPPEDNG